MLECVFLRMPEWTFKVLGVNVLPSETEHHVCRVHPIPLVRGQMIIKVCSVSRVREICAHIHCKDNC